MIHSGAVSEPSLYEQVLERIAAGGGELATPPQVRPSAGIVPWRRRSDGELEVFWLRRAAALPFMGGFWAFPGGGLGRDDEQIRVGGYPSGVETAPAAAALPEAVTGGFDLGTIVIPGLLAAAVRELFEETGILLVEPQPPAEALGEPRRALLAKERGFASLLEQLGGRASAARLTYAGRWLTPPFQPLRFDNRFFLLEWSVSEVIQPTVDPGEAEMGEWIRPADALGRWAAGDVMAAPPILHLLRVLAEEGPEAGLPRLWAPTEANLGSYRAIEFRPGVLLFPLPTPTLPPAQFTNAYLIGKGRCALVDPGAADPRVIDDLVRALRAAHERFARETTEIWLTHHHPDHVGGVEALRPRLRVPVLAHAETARLLADRGLHVDGELADGQVRDLGGSVPFPVRILHTPGHAPGHLAFYDETLGSLLCGDLASGISTIVVDPPFGDMDLYLDSLARMRDLAPRALFPAHGPAIADAVGKLQELIDHRLWREARILAAWRSGLREPGAMAAAVYDDVPAIAQPLAERQTLAHLERLRRHGLL